MLPLNALSLPNRCRNIGFKYLNACICCKTLIEGKPRPSGQRECQMMSGLRKWEFLRALYHYQPQCIHRQMVPTYCPSSIKRSTQQSAEKSLTFTWKSAGNKLVCQLLPHGQSSQSEANYQLKTQNAIFESARKEFDINCRCPTPLG